MDDFRQSTSDIAIPPELSSIESQWVQSVGGLIMEQHRVTDAATPGYYHPTQVSHARLSAMEECVLTRTVVAQ